MRRKELAVKEKIANVLIQHSEDSFLSIEQIASIAYGDAYLKETKKHLDGLVKRNMIHAIALLVENNLIVIKNAGSYKIADESDNEYVIRNLISKKERLEISQQIN